MASKNGVLSDFSNQSGCSLKCRNGKLNDEIHLIELFTKGAVDA
jgi:hypothetical protein